MKRLTLFLLVLTFSLAVAVSAQQKKMEKPMEKEMTILGEVVDVSCYLHLGNGGRGESHKDCAVACAKNGGPLGILTSDGKLYVSIIKDEHKENPYKGLMDHIGHTVEAKGFVHSSGGVNGLRITGVTMAKKM